jgi:hypothetical protein
VLTIEQIKMQSSALPTHYTPTGLAFSNGTEIPASIIVFSTGFEGNIRTEMARIFGQDIAARAEDFWGLDEEGELKGVFKRHPRMPGLWYVGGTIGHARYYSRFVALQIKAEAMGTPFPLYENERELELTTHGPTTNGH